MHAFRGREAVDVFLMLLIGHALADYPLQGDFLARAKNRAMPVNGVPWFHALAAHALIHGGAVWAATGNAWLGVAEIVLHALIDDAKCTQRISFNVDQALHVACKALWALIALYVTGR